MWLDWNKIKGILQSDRVWVWGLVVFDVESPVYCVWDKRIRGLVCTMIYASCFTGGLFIDNRCWGFFYIT